MKCCLTKNRLTNVLFGSFHRTDLYQYTSDDRSTAALLNFVLKDYANYEALTVPPPIDHK